MKFKCEKCGAKKITIVWLKTTEGQPKEAKACTKCGRIELCVQNTTQSQAPLITAVTQAE